MPVEPKKDEGPATEITFLGLRLDTEKMEIRLPQEKLKRLKGVITSWRGRKAGKTRDLLSLVGLLTQASRAVRPGRAYVRRLINLSTMTNQMDHYVRINREARADMEWWHRFLGVWNGTAMMFATPKTDPDITLTSDASGNWGCRAYPGCEWFMLPWAGPIRELHITIKELAPIVVAAVIWGPKWKGKTILARCDNVAVVAIVNSGTSKNPQAMNLIRCLSFLSAIWEFRVRATHLSGIQNTLADALSRDNLPLFCAWRPAPSAHPGSRAGPDSSQRTRLDSQGLDRAVDYYMTTR